ncbi:endonuclease/exonuclease/phosphatase family protein [Aspergillus lucknowensis]|uniref:Endonuclease/exonuclease/phosphatase n=1 Tax=Aspergillus lucknowensis TaxID=176173 RepID=A0ABR4LT34_9EURO
MASLQRDSATQQDFYFFDDSADPPAWCAASSSPARESHATTPTPRIHLISWNIDFQAPAEAERMTAALQYLGDLVSEHNRTHSSRTVILFQEMVSKDLELIQQTAWVQKDFYITDLQPSHWYGRYGTTTLIDRRLSVDRVFRVPYAESRMQRDVLCVDLDMPDPMRERSTVRVCNTHLESLASGTPRRPVQLKVASEFMHGAGPRARMDNKADNLRPNDQNTILVPVPHAAILAGDLNAFAPEDASIPQACRLKDAFLVLGGKEKTEEAITWGKQNPDWMTFPADRLDKVLFCGGVEVLSYRKIGEGLKARVSLYNSDDSDGDPDEYEDVWVTDHFGMVAEFRIFSGSDH